MHLSFLRLIPGKSAIAVRRCSIGHVRHIQTSYSQEFFKEWNNLPVYSGGNIHADLSSVSIPIYVKSEWTDRCTVGLTYIRDGGDDTTSMDDLNDCIDVSTDTNTNTIFVKSLYPKIIVDNVEVHIIVPQSFNIWLHAMDRDISIKGKLKGNIFLKTNQGNIAVESIRGESIKISAEQESGLVTGNDLEGGVHVVCKSLNVKKIFSHNAYLHASEQCTIGALYSSNAVIKCFGKIQIGSSHGSITAKGSRDVQLDGINGNVTIHSIDNISAHFDSVESGSNSELTSSHGNVSISFSEDSSTQIDIKATDIKLGSSAIEGCLSKTSVTGEIHGKSIRFEKRNSGKIDYESANAQKLAAFSSKKFQDHKTKVTVLATNGTVSLQIYNWMERIKSKYIK